MYSAMCKLLNVVYDVRAAQNTVMRVGSPNIVAERSPHRLQEGLLQ